MLGSAEDFHLGFPDKTFFCSDPTYLQKQTLIGILKTTFLEFKTITELKLLLKRFVSSELSEGRDTVSVDAVDSWFWDTVTLHGAKWMFWSYVNGHYPDEQDENKAASLTLTHKMLMSCMAFNQSSGYLVKDSLQTQTQTWTQLPSICYFMITPTEKDSDRRTKHQTPNLNGELWQTVSTCLHSYPYGHPTPIPWPPEVLALKG